jgi:Glycosyl-4,4'-diaponeurosporenoate acyltransferase
MAWLNPFDIWLRPKRFESERLYERLGALIIKRYVPTGGDLVMLRLRRKHPERRWVTSNLVSLRKYEARTRLNESIHLVGFVGFAGLAVEKFASGTLSVHGLIIALALNLIFGLWPVILQRYNRLRLYRAIERFSDGLERRQRRRPEARKSSQSSSSS